jgi:hypothetical protein
VARRDDLHAGLGVLGDQLLHALEPAFGQLVDLAHDHQIRRRQLVLEQLLQRPLVIEVGVVLALLVDRVRIIRELAAQHRRSVDQRDHRVDGASRADLRPLKGLHQGLGQREAAGLDHDVVDPLAALEQGLEHRHELFLHRAAQAAVGQLVQRSGLALFLFAADAALAQQLAIDADLAELVHDHRELAAVGVRQQVAQQGGLPAAEKAGHDRGGELLHGDSSGSGMRQTKCPRSATGHVL